MLLAQTDCPGPCPNIQQLSATIKDKQVTDLGIAQNAQVSVEVVDNANGDFDEDQVNTIEEAADNILAQPGDNGDSTTVNTDTASSPSSGTVSNPLVVVEIETQATLDAECATVLIPQPAACTTPRIQAQSSTSTVGNTTYAHVGILTSAVSGPFLKKLMEHEFAHGLLGNADCEGCANTIANPQVTENSPDSPTCCDNQQSKKSWCKCNKK